MDSKTQTKNMKYIITSILQNYRLNNFKNYSDYLLIIEKLLKEYDPEKYLNEKDLINNVTRIIKDIYKIYE